MGSTAAAYSYRRLTLSNLAKPPLRRESTVASAPRHSITSASTQTPSSPYTVYPVGRINFNPSRPPSRTPSQPPSRDLSRKNTERNFDGRGFSIYDANGKVKWEEVREVAAPKEPIWKKIINVIKILLPHVGLNILLLSYITMGATVFMWLEADNELRGRRDKMDNINKAYDAIINETVAMCGGRDKDEIDLRIRPLLHRLSETHEYDDKFADDRQLWHQDSGKNTTDMTTRWTFAAATLYALTVITSTGYDHVTPTTDPGRVFTVFFGLLGIPLMFITAADIGKFLSEIVIRSYAQLLALWQRVASLVECIRYKMFPSDVDSIDSMELKKNRHRGEDDEEEEDDEDERLQLPVASYFALIIGYCCIGSMIFNSFEGGPIWSFIHGVFFSFNTITTIGLGNIQVQSHIYLGICVTYVIIGLAVITASLDLCSSTLKRTFTKLHYFGRKIRGARKGFATMSDDIREAMRIIAALKKTRAGKERITLEDLKRFLEVQEHLLRQPYVPYNVHFFRWIEDANRKEGDKDIDDLYASYLDEVSTNGKSPISPLSHKMSTSDPMLFF